MSPLRIIFAGSGEFGVPTLAALGDRRVHELLWRRNTARKPPCQPRALGVTATPISQWATQRPGLPVISTDNINALSLPEADLMVVIAFGQKIAQAGH